LSRFRMCSLHEIWQPNTHKSRVALTMLITKWLDCQKPCKAICGGGSGMDVFAVQIVRR